jgi:hypothetical protein
MTRRTKRDTGRKDVEEEEEKEEEKKLNEGKECVADWTDTICQWKTTAGASREFEAQTREGEKKRECKHTFWGVC